LSNYDREESITMQSPQLSRRVALEVGAASLVLPLVHIRTAGAVGRLSVELWDHWVEAGNDAIRKLTTNIPSATAGSLSAASATRRHCAQVTDRI
jgi:hypothetical protein